MIAFDELWANNFGPFESFKLSLKERGLVHVRGDNSDTTAADSNGSGKTHVLKAISFCLFGETPDGDKADKLLRIGAERMETGVSWDDEDGHWAAHRNKPKVGSSTLVFEHNGQDVSAPTIAATQQEINERLGLDFATWRNTVLYAQGDVVRFADPGTTDADRKLILKRILRLDVLDKANEAAKTKMRLLASNNVLLEQEASRIIAELNGMSSGDALQTQLEQLQAELVEQEKTAKQLTKLRELDNMLIEAIGDARKQLSEQTSAQQEANKAREKAAAKTAEARAAARDWERTNADLAAMGGRIQGLIDGLDNELAEISAFEKGGACPSCGTKTTSPNVKRHIATLKKAAQHAYEVSMDQLRDEEQDTRSNLAAVKALETELLASAQACLEAAATATERATAIKREVDAEVAKWTPKQTEVRRDLAISEQAGVIAASTRRRIDGIKQSLKAVDDKRTGLTQRGTEIQAEIETAEEERIHINFWQKGFSNAGMSSMLMDAVMPELTKRANHYLELLSDGDISISFDTQSKLKTGESREKLSINWMIEGVPDSTPSGGQRKKISIAVDLALMDLVAQRERSAVDLLLLDEMLDGLDAAGRNRVMALLAELRQKRSTILVISHDSTISELFEHTMIVQKSNHIATLMEES